MLTKRKRLTREVDKGTYNYILFHVMSCFFLPKPLEGLALCSQQVISLERATMTSDLVFPGFYSDIRAFFLWFSLLFPCFCFFSLSLSLSLSLSSPRKHGGSTDVRRVFRTKPTIPHAVLSWQRTP
ncbi:uncharacterized protein BDW43DRAFT_283984 [Aspergillus alliaceus]|uniref:uncharacterized protein n=1 Tax=Petromyces alliaceus TaxID=209559 RepID=UPI0012A6FFBA|nr:uncharacterized protein BDW43DRAFT_283984 [Aspergillus alliaceus]KAB8230997.1 hypothetical protein BDW43DRAFT_283984 [Aspergillus alliaceus]